MFLGICYPPCKLTVRTQKWMVGIRSFPLGMAYFNGLFNGGDILANPEGYRKTNNGHWISANAHIDGWKTRKTIFSFWNAPFSGDMLLLGRVAHFLYVFYTASIK